MPLRAATMIAAEAAGTFRPSAAAEKLTGVNL
jgi:hypothetical protein